MKCRHCLINLCSLSDIIGRNSDQASYLNKFFFKVDFKANFSYKNLKIITVSPKFAAIICDKLGVSLFCSTYTFTLDFVVS